MICVSGSFGCNDKKGVGHSGEPWAFLGYLWGVYETLRFPSRHPVLRLEEKEEEEMVRIIPLPLSLLKSNYDSGLLP